MNFLAQFKSLNKIGSSNNSVIYNADNKQALKVVVHDAETPHSHSLQCEHLKNEAKLLKKLDHPNIIKCQKYHQSLQNKDQMYCCIQEELGDMDLFSLIEKTFPEKIDIQTLKQLVHQVCQGLQYLHNKANIAHNDIKLENVLLFLSDEGTDSVSAVPKIADFGFSRVQDDSKDLEDFYERWNNRSNSSLAPEILRFKKYYREKKFEKIIGAFDEKKSEMFSLGIMIFSAFFLRSPISSETAHTQDKYYKYFYTKQYEKFWAQQDFQFEFKRISKEPNSKMNQFQNLIQGLLAANPKERFDINQVVNHPWFQQD